MAASPAEPTLRASGHGVLARDAGDIAAGIRRGASSETVAPGGMAVSKWSPDEVPLENAARSSGLVIQLAAWLVTIWAMGACLIGARTALELKRLGVFGRTAQRMTHGPLAELVGELSNGRGIARPVCLLQSDHCSIPMTWGTI